MSDGAARHGTVLRCCAVQSPRRVISKRTCSCHSIASDRGDSQTICNAGCCRCKNRSPIFQCVDKTWTSFRFHSLGIVACQYSSQFFTVQKLTITWMRGFIVFSATAQPAIKPPPPTGIMTASTSGTCSHISSPMVP